MRSSALLPVVVALATAAGFGGLRAPAQTGERIYRQYCAECHESGQNRAPTLEALRQLPADAILASLRTGTMAAVGATLPPGHDEAVSAFLGKAPQPRTASAAAACPDMPLGDVFAGPRWIGWSADLENSRFQSADFAGLTVDSVPQLRLRWAFGLPDADRVRGSPTVAGGRVFFGARNGRVYALDARSGCTVWEFRAEAEVRTGIVASSRGSGADAMLYFGDTKANLYAVEAATGRRAWMRKVSDHPAATLTGSPVLHHGRLYFGLSSIEEFTGALPSYSCCTFRGSVAAVDADDGEVVWKTYTVPETPQPTRPNGRGVMQYGPSGAAVWSAPTIDARLGRIYVTTGDNYTDPPTDDSDAIIAFDLATGARLWSRQFTHGDAYNIACNSGRRGENCPDADGPDFDFGSPAILVETEGGQRLLVAGQKSGMVHAVDPDRDGAIVWQRRAGEGGKLGGIQFGPAADARNVYVAVSDYRSRDPGRGGGLTAFRLADGELQWRVPGFPCPEGRKGCSPAQSAAVTVIPGVVFSGSLDGFIRAYSTEDGSVLWSYDTARAYAETVNGVPAAGGSINGPGPVAVAGSLYVNSGYGLFGSMPGNAVLAFGVEGE